MSSPVDSLDSLIDDVDSVVALVDDVSDLLDTVADGNGGRIGMGILTIFPPSTHPSWLDPGTYLTNPTHSLDKWCGKFEVAPTTGELHAHIFFKFQNDKRPRFSQFRKLISDKINKGCDIKRSRSHSGDNQQCCINYVLKTETAAPDTIPFIWKNSCVFSQKHWDKRTKKPVDKTTERTKYIMSKPQHWTWARILHEDDDSRALLADCSWGKKFHDMRAASNPRRKIQKVIIMYGAGGTGKTTLAEHWDSTEDEPVEVRYYKRNGDDGAFWGGGSTSYKGQRVIHFEEFGGGETLSNIKTWCDLDKVGPSVNIKNGGTELNHETVIFTSNDHPAGWYRNKWTKDPKQFHPFWRRVTSVRFFPDSRIDGSPNRPDDANPPYYIDQTDQWIGMQGCYDSALAHAEAHWPLAELEPTESDSPFAFGFTPPVDRKRGVEEVPFHTYSRTGKFPKKY